MEGIVKWFDVGKGYGFIRRDGGPDVYVHHRAIVGPFRLNEGDRVGFELTEGPRGPTAINVQLIG